MSEQANLHRVYDIKNMFDDMGLMSFGAFIGQCTR